MLSSRLTFLISLLQPRRRTSWAGRLYCCWPPLPLQAPDICTQDKEGGGSRAQAGNHRPFRAQEEQCIRGHHDREPRRWRRLGSAAQVLPRAEDHGALPPFRLVVLDRLLAIAFSIL